MHSALNPTVNPQFWWFDPFLISFCHSPAFLRHIWEPSSPTSVLYYSFIFSSIYNSSVLQIGTRSSIIFLVIAFRDLVALLQFPYQLIIDRLSTSLDFQLLNLHLSYHRVGVYIEEMLYKNTTLPHSSLNLLLTTVASIPSSNYSWLGNVRRFQ